MQKGGTGRVEKRGTSETGRLNRVSHGFYGGGATWRRQGRSGVVV